MFDQLKFYHINIKNFSNINNININPVVSIEWALNI